jgi:metal-responsive CopG/Arc/MetJ family transcriptional regulator
METIQVVLDAKQLQAADRVARRTNRNRSASIRDALREHLRTPEDRDREGYAKQPQARDEPLAWDAEAAWPAE